MRKTWRHLAQKEQSKTPLQKYSGVGNTIEKGRWANCQKKSWKFDKVLQHGRIMGHVQGKVIKSKEPITYYLSYLIKSKGTKVPISNIWRDIAQNEQVKTIPLQKYSWVGNTTEKGRWGHYQKTSWKIWQNATRMHWLESSFPFIGYFTWWFCIGLSEYFQIHTQDWEPMERICGSTVWWQTLVQSSKVRVWKYPTTQHRKQSSQGQELKRAPKLIWIRHLLCSSKNSETNDEPKSIQIFVR